MIVNPNEWAKETITPWSEEVTFEKGVSYGAKSNSYSLRLGTHIKMIVFGVKKEYWLKQHEAITLQPGQTMTCHSEEKLDIPFNMAAFTIGEPALNRLGIQVIQEFYHSGYRGDASLYIINSGLKAVNLYRGEGIVQLIMQQTSSVTQVKEKINNEIPETAIATSLFGQYRPGGISRYDATSHVWDNGPDSD